MKACVVEYALDGVIRDWRANQDDGHDPDGIAKYYIDAYQCIRVDLLGTPLDVPLNEEVFDGVTPRPLYK